MANGLISRYHSVTPLSPRIRLPSSSCRTRQPEQYRHDHRGEGDKLGLRDAPKGRSPLPHLDDVKSGTVPRISEGHTPVDKVTTAAQIEEIIVSPERDTETAVRPYGAAENLDLFEVDRISLRRQFEGRETQVPAKTTSGTNPQRAASR